MKPFYVNSSKSASLLLCFHSLAHHYCCLCHFIQIAGKMNSCGKVFTVCGHPITSVYLLQSDFPVAESAPCYNLVSCPARARLPARNGLVNEVEFLGFITQNG